jgi:soluble lytic murein transglycosylase-like protein
MRRAAVGALLLWAAAAATAAGDPRAAMEAAAARQVAAVAAMDRPMARQRVAVERQARSAAPWPAPATRVPVDPPQCARLPEAEAEAIIEEAAAREGLAPALLRAVIERESGFRPCAVSPKGALGLMQLMPGTAADLGVGDVFDPAENVGSGARFLARLLERYGGDLELALGAYNAGPARVDAGGGVPDIPETRDYVRAILGRLGIR